MSHRLVSKPWGVVEAEEEDGTMDVEEDQVEKVEELEEVVSMLPKQFQDLRLAPILQQL